LTAYYLIEFMKTPIKKTKKAPSPDDQAAIEVEASSAVPARRKTRAKSADQKDTVDVTRSAEKRRVRKSSSADKDLSAKDVVEPKQTKTRKKRSVSEQSVTEATAPKATSPVKRKRQAKKVDLVKAAVEPIKGIEALSRVDNLLANPELPPLERENRARLQMQTPTKLYFYWSVRRDPWALLRKAFGDDTGSYTLVLKLVELRSGTEEIYNADAEGNWWFDVRPDGKYRAEIGFYAPNRPYFRIVYSNVVETPRKRPSPRRATEADWMVTADKFARVLDVAGFSSDALDVAIAGDDAPAFPTAAHTALYQFTGGSGSDRRAFDDEDIRYAMLAIASGQKLDDLRWQISPELFAYLQASDKRLDSQTARDALREHFVIADESFESEEIGPGVFGASLVNFPRRTRRQPRLFGPGYLPESSHSFRRP
jgi:hypothetical protein